MSRLGNSREPLSIESIRITRAPGIEGAFALTDLGPGITVIHGPNGSGKSTTARSLHSLLWPDPANDGCLIEATIRYDGSRWTIRRDGASVRCQRDGQDHDPPLTFPYLTPETRDRYHLALHDLLRADDREFAARVTREASGGFDLEAAASALKFNTAPTDPRSVARALKDAQKIHREVVDKQNALRQEEAALDTLNAESERAKQAGINALKLNAIGEALDARAELHEAIAECHRFDTGMAHVAATHAGMLAEWRKQEPLLRQKLADIDAALSREQERMVQTGLPLEHDCARAIRVLERQYDELIEAEAARREADIALVSARQQLEALRDQIAPHLPESLRTDQALTLLRAYDEALNRYEEASRIGDAENRLAHWIPRPGSVPDPDRLREALNLLAGWLQTPPPPVEAAAAGRARLYALIAAALIVAQGVLLGVNWNPLGYLLAAIGVVIGLLAVLTGHDPVPVDERQRFEEAYLRLGLAEPTAWDEQAVAAHLELTQNALLRERSMALNTDLWRTLAPSLEQRHQALTDATEQKNALEEQLGVGIRFDRPALATLTTALDGWLKASQEAERLDRNRALRAELAESGLAAFNLTAADLRGESATTGNDAKAVLGHLQDRHDELKQAARAIEKATTERETQVLPDLERITQGRADLIARYGGFRSLDQIESLAGQHERWQQALQLVRSRRDRFDTRRAQLDPDISLAEWTLEQVQTGIADERAIEAQATDVNQQIGAIRNSIQAAKSRDDVAAALSGVETAREALRERRDDHLLKSVGGLLLEAVRRETREANLPAVAHRARELFAEITHGRYRLNFNPGPPASFTATDTTTGAEQALNQLSSGTRVQLLIAVRTAFVEQNEPDASLPMIFDETLANADAARAEALIEATFRLCDAGRQIIYFTAQIDEVEKWRHLAAERPTDIQVIDLAEARKLDAITRPALAALSPVERPAFPAPNGHTRLEYRHALGAPPLNLWSVDGGDIHLWHLMDDLGELHRLVTGRNVSRWGQVRQFTVNGASPALGLDRATIARMAVRAETCVALIDAARIGRGRRVTSQDLYASNGMGGKHDDACLRLLEECEGDGQRFVECLENKAIAGFYTSRIDRFREHFETNGHIVADIPLTADEIRIRVARRMTEAIAAGLIDLDAIDRLMEEGFLTAGTVADTLGDEAPVLSVVN